MSEQPSFVYVADPMCSWCWGFAPVIEAVAERYELPVQLVMGGLRGGSEARMMTDRLADELGHHWEQVDRASGQPFDLHVLDRRDWRYDTEVTCRAVVVVRELAPELARPALHHLQRAFYVEGTPVVDDETAVDVVSAFLTEHGREDLVRPFATQLVTEEARAATRADRDLARSWGVSGFPTLLVRLPGDADELVVVSPGWQRIDDVTNLLDRWLSKNFAGAIAGTPAGDACGIDGTNC